MDRKTRLEITRFCLLLIGAIFGGMLNITYMAVPAVVGIIAVAVAYMILPRGEY